MNKRTVSCLILAASVLLLLWWRFHSGAAYDKETVTLKPNIPALQDKTMLSNAPALAPSPRFATTKLVNVLAPESRHLFKATNYPPQTAEEKAQWQWWDEMEKTDPDWQWKMPIEFYGKVVDQFGHPIAGAEVELGWTTAVGPIPDPKKTIYSDANGRFAVTGIQGKRLVVTVYKEGYLHAKSGIQGFEYAAFYESNFYVPDPNNPVIFRMQKLLGAEPMYKFIPDGEIALGQPLILNVEKGKVAAQGNLAISVEVGTETNHYGSDFIVNMEGLNGASFAFSDEEFLFNAPDSGYRSVFSVTHKVNAPNYHPEQPLRFYIRTGAGKYAAVEMEITMKNDLSKAHFLAIVYYNPSGSRNLEFDQNKWINR
jgi:Carboxypeptidase regulatory-like domain